MKYRKRNFFDRLTASYFLLVLIIVGLIAVSSYTVFRKIYMENADEINKRSLKITMELYEEKVYRPLTEIYTEFFSSSEMGRLGTVFFEQGTLEVMDIYQLYKSLQNKVLANEYISEIHLYSSINGHEMISSRFGYKSGVYVDQILENMGIDKIDAETVFPVITGAFSYMNDNSTSYYSVVYSSSMRHGSENAAGYLIFTLNTDKISTMLNQEDSHICILGKDGEILCAYDRNLIGEILEIPVDTDDDYSVIWKDEEVISWVRSSMNNLFLSSETSAEGFYPAVKQMLSWMLFITAAILFLGFMVSYWISGYVARPIIQVVDQISDTISGSDRTGRRDLEGIVTMICNEFHSLDQFMKRNKGTIKNNYILNLYLNQTDKVKELEGKKEYIGFNGQGNCIPALVCCSFKGNVGVDARQMAIYKYIYDLENSEQLQQVIAAEVEDNVIAVIHKGEDAGKFETLLTSVLEKTGEKSFICCGAFSAGDIQTGNIFQCLKEMMPYHYFYPEKRIWRAGDIAVTREKMTVDMADFERALKNSQVKECLLELQKVLGEMDQKRIPYEKRQEVLVLFVSSVANLARSMGLHLESVRELIDADDIRQFAYMFEITLNEFVNQRTARQRTKRQEEIEKIRGYIIAHYNQDISLSMIAEMMDMNPAYISRLFKEMTGQNVTEYVKTIKLAEAERLLRTTDYSIDHISKMTGYNTTHYFIRQFKEKYGKTPTVYRKENR